MDSQGKLSQIVLELSVLETAACIRWRQECEEERRKGGEGSVSEKWASGCSDKLLRRKNLTDNSRNELSLWGCLSQNKAQGFDDRGEMYYEF